MTDPHTDARETWLSPSAALNRLQLDDDELENEATATFGMAEYVQQRHGVAIGSFRVLLPGDVVSEVVKGAAIYPVPKTAEWVKGLLNLRGNLVPVFDLAEHLDTNARAPESPQIVAVGKAEQAIALIVDGIPRPASTSQAISHSALAIPEGMRKHVRGAFTEDDDMWLDLDFSGLIESLTDKMED
jgi:twitching motility protein PilI